MKCGNFLCCSFTLDKSNLNLTSIKVEEFENFDNWTFIDFSYNLINSIDLPEQLRGQKHLESLQLDFNRNFNEDGNKQIFVHETLQRFSCKGCGFTKIQTKHFTALPQLTSLNLSANHITLIDSDAFELNRNLRHLDVSENKLLDIHYQTFSKLRNFEELQLSKNELKLHKNKPFLKSDSLKQLMLDSCGFVEIYRETFSEMKGLETLSLNSNLIESLSVDVFKMNNKLAHLSLESNCLKLFPVSILDFLPQLKELCVDKNKFVNSQEFAKFVSIYEKKNLRSSNCSSDTQHYIEFLLKSETTTEKWREKLSHEGISDFFLGSYLSIILLVQAVLLVLLSLYFIKVSKYEKLGRGDDCVNYANTILNDDDFYKLYKLDE